MNALENTPIMKQRMGMIEQVEIVGSNGRETQSPKGNKRVIVADEKLDLSKDGPSSPSPTPAGTNKENTEAGLAQNFPQVENALPREQKAPSIVSTKPKRRRSLVEHLVNVNDETSVVDDDLKNTVNELFRIRGETAIMAGADTGFSQKESGKSPSMFRRRMPKRRHSLVGSASQASEAMQACADASQASRRITACADTLHEKEKVDTRSSSVENERGEASSTLPQGLNRAASMSSLAFPIVDTAGAPPAPQPGSPPPALEITSNGTTAPIQVDDEASSKKSTVPKRRRSLVEHLVVPDMKEMQNIGVVNRPPSPDTSESDNGDDEVILPPKGERSRPQENPSIKGVDLDSVKRALVDMQDSMDFLMKQITCLEQNQ